MSPGSAQRNAALGTKRRAWTEAEVRALGVRIDGVLAVEIVTGYARSTAYTLLQTPEALPFRVLKIGRRYVTSGAEVLRALGLEPSLDSKDSSPPSTAVVGDQAAAQGP